MNYFILLSSTKKINQKKIKKNNIVIFILKQFRIHIIIITYIKSFIYYHNRLQRIRIHKFKFSKHLKR